MMPTKRQATVTTLFAAWFTLHAAWFYYCRWFFVAALMSVAAAGFWYWAGLGWRERRRK